MYLFNFSLEEILTFFAVLVRVSIMLAILPFFGDTLIPSVVKVLFALVVVLGLYPTLVKSGLVRPQDAALWASTTSGIAVVVALEVVFALVVGFTSRMFFEAINFCGNMVGTYMGFSMASIYDPHSQSQSQVVAQVYAALAMLLFLSIDGQRFMLDAILKSYEVVGIGGAVISVKVVDLLTKASSDVVRIGIQLSGPMAFCVFTLNLVFGIFSKALPQLNILVLSMGVTVIVGLGVMWISLPHTMDSFENVFEKSYISFREVMKAMGG